MSNGSQCCALEICCDAAAQRAKLPKAIAAFTGADEEYCAKFLDWMAHEDVVFAPKSFAAVIADIAAVAKKHSDGK